VVKGYHHGGGIVGGRYHVDGVTMTREKQKGEGKIDDSMTNDLSRGCYGKRSLNFLCRKIMRRERVAGASFPPSIYITATCSVCGAMISRQNLWSSCHM
jgi:hypothetical protein